MSEHRLIDANALKANMFLYAAPEMVWDKADIVHKIDETPTIEERKTGKWERHYSRPNVYADMCWHCSNCGYKTPDSWANKWKFCPDCGARMQEGEDNGQTN